MSATSKLSSKYQISIPKAVRERLGWRSGQKIAFIDHGHSMMMVPVPCREELAGMAGGANTDTYRDRNDRY
ncbi:MAG: AbrB/MazE/SpoVT family DNA-binding domain-containing protein [Hyphomicrobiales bacterium]|nr:AbrB/MazE/SpoVT family DNA-binding domain-containing protein [Hyphomicrobiales bacterium]